MQAKNVSYSETQVNTAYQATVNDDTVEVWEGEDEFDSEPTRDSFHSEAKCQLETNEVRSMIHDLLEFAQGQKADPDLLNQIGALLAKANHAVALQPEARQRELEKIVAQLSHLESEVVLCASGDVSESNSGGEASSGTRKSQLNDQLMKLQEQVSALDLNYLEKEPLQKLLQDCENNISSGKLDDAEMTIMQLSSQLQSLEEEKHAGELLQLSADETAVKDFLSELEDIKFRVPTMKDNFVAQGEALLKDLRSGAKTLEQVEQDLEKLQTSLEAVEASQMFTFPSV